MKRIVRRHRDADVQRRFEDEAGVGQTGRNAHVRYRKGLDPVAPTDRRFESVYVYGAVRLGADDAFGPILPRADTTMMSLFLDAFSAALAPKVHAILVMDKARDGTSLGGRRCRRTSASRTCRRTRRS